jgi:diguanylate cyclase (GGDEF)-like protein/PAS domain S-box-containing protein
MHRTGRPKWCACDVGAIVAGAATTVVSHITLVAGLNLPSWHVAWSLGASLAAGVLVAAVIMWGRRTRQRRVQTEHVSRVASHAIVTASLEGSHAVAWGRALGAPSLSEVSPNVDQLLGYPRAVWLAPGAWRRFVHPEDEAAARDAYRHGIDHGTPFEVSYRMRHRDGRVLEVRDRIAVVHDADGREMLRGLLLDTTREHDAIARVRASEAHFRGIFEQAAIGIVICDAAGVIERVNQRFCAIVGREARTIIGARFDEVLAPMAPQQGAPASAATRRCFRPDGVAVWTHVAFSTQRDEQGTVRALLVTVQDITHLQTATTALAEEERRLRALLATLGEGVIVRDTHGTIVLHNAAAARIFGLDDGRMRRFRVDSGEIRYICEDGTDYPLDTLPAMRTLQDGEGHSGLVGIVRGDGSTRWLWAHSQPVLDEAGALDAVVTAVADITHMREAETRLRLADKAIDHSADAIMITTAEGHILRVNPAFTRVTGYSAEDVVGKTPAMFRSGRHDRTFYAQMWAAIRDHGSWQGDIWNRHKDGRLYAERLSISTVRDSAGRPAHYVAVFSDVTEERNKEQHYAHLAHHDALTGLPNRSLMADRLAQSLNLAQRNRRQVALMFLDLDRFKSINDTLGHTGGDALLKAVADRLEASVRESDSVGRQSGDEFLVLLPDLEDGGQAAQVAQKILAALSQPISIDGQQIHASASIGIALYPDDAHDTSALLSHADTALYHAKAAGRNTFRYFTESMNAESERRLRLEHQLHVALQQGKMRLLYQPLKRLADGRIVAMEAICRWKSALLGDIAPTAFLAHSGDLALAKALDCWTLDTACREAARWQAEGIEDVRVAVNITARHFRQDSLVDSIRHALAAAALPAGCLEIELTERVLHETDPTVAHNLRTLKNMGIRLVLDEFGTGYNTLTRLKDVGIDRLKMDRSVLANLDQSDDHVAIMRAMIELGRHLNIEVLADGLETETQHARILDAGCALAQGALLDAPMAGPQAIERLKSPGPALGGRSARAIQ